ncbi:MAG: FG-GAP repeat protein, partial [Planctomycetota bacterium]
NHPGARVILYNTWAREPGNSSLIANFNNDPLEMLSFTNLGYDRIRSNPPAWDHSDIVSIARVGDAWQQWYSDYSYSSVERLHAGDGTHQNQRGSYLAASVLFETITGKSSIGNPFAGSYLGGVSGAIGGVSTLLLLQQYATATSSALRMDTGSVVVFERAAGLWSETQRLSALDAEAFARFGASVAIDGDRLAIGAPAADGGRGAVYLFELNPFGEWDQTAQITATGGAPGDEFGSALALSGDRLAVGAPERDVIGFQFHAEAGTAYVFVESGGQWSQEARIEAPDASSADDFGRALVLSSDSLLVGAPGDDDVGVDAGSVYAYTRTGTSWNLDGEVRASDTAGGDEFGRALDLDGSLAIVGAPGDDDGALNAGSATILEQSAGQWAAVATLRPSSPGLTDAAGSSVALRGGLALLGTPFDDPSGSDSGSVTLFRQVGTQWPEVETLTASDGLLGDAFGSAVALGESEALVGAPLSNGVGADSGSAYHFDLVDPLSEFFSFCFGDGGDGTGCTACPCGNDAPSGSGGGCLNEAGQSARLLLSGSASVGADTLRFTLENANPSTFAILFSGASRAPANAANPCFGADSGVTSPALNGLRCAVQQVLRHGTRPTDSAGAVGLTTAGWGAPNGPPGGLLASGGFVAGQTRHFQVIYRETPTATCTTNQNTSPGVTVIVTP